jgi:tetratricopeptide (TPR) repeat protein
MEKAAELAPEDPFLCFRLADLYRSQRKVDAAIEEFQRLLTITEDPAIPQLRLSELYLEKGEHEKALESIEQVLQRSSESADAQHIAGQIFEATGQPDEARAAYEKSFALNGIMFDAMYRLALLLRRSENPDDVALARSYLERHQKIEPEWPNIIRARNELEVNPRNAEVIARIAFHLNRAEEFEQARLWIERSLSLDPRRPQSHVFAGYIANNIGEKEAALKHFEYVIQLTGPEALDAARIQGYIEALRGGQDLGIIK